MANDWIHCPDPEKQARIRREMQERHEYLWPTPVKRRGAPFSSVMRGNLTGNYPLVRWQTVGDDHV